MCYYKPKFLTYQNVKPFSASVWDNTCLEATGKGTIELTALVKSTAVRCKFMNELYISGLQYDLISVGIMEETGCSVTFERSGVSITRESRILVEGIWISSQSILNLADTQTSTSFDAGLITLVWGFVTSVLHRFMWTDYKTWPKKSFCCKRKLTIQRCGQFLHPALKLKVLKLLIQISLLIAMCQSWVLCKLIFAHSQCSL